jgi:hypothetical protein
VHTVLFARAASYGGASTVVRTVKKIQNICGKNDNRIKMNRAEYVCGVLRRICADLNIQVGDGCRTVETAKMLKPWEAMCMVQWRRSIKR